MADTTFTTAPAETVKRKFSTSVETTGGEPGASPAIPPINIADLAQQPTPDTGPSQAEIEAFYKPLLDQIQNQQQPLSRPVPADISPTGTFLGLLAGNLASTFAQNPAFAQQAHQYIADQSRQKQAIEEQNYATQLASDAEKRNKIITLRGQILEHTLDEAIKKGDLQAANVASQNLARFQEGLKRESQREEAQQRLAIVQEQGRQERLTEKTKASVRASEEKTAAAKPMTTKEYLQGVNDINKNKNLPGVGFREGVNRAMGGVFGTPQPSGHEEALEQFHASAVLNGEPTVKTAAKQNLKRIILSRLGLIGKTPDAAAKARVKAELEKYGLTFKDVQ
jgi:hypothetical protein